MSNQAIPMCDFEEGPARQNLYY